MPPWRLTNGFAKRVNQDCKFQEADLNAMVTVELAEMYPTRSIAQLWIFRAGIDSVKPTFAVPSRHGNVHFSARCRACRNRRRIRPPSSTR
jgi:hypothetical protein